MSLVGHEIGCNVVARSHCHSLTLQRTYAHAHTRTRDTPNSVVCMSLFSRANSRCGEFLGAGFCDDLLAVASPDGVIAIWNVAQADNRRSARASGTIFSSNKPEMDVPVTVKVPMKRGFESGGGGDYYDDGSKDKGFGDNAQSNVVASAKSVPLALFSTVGNTMGMAAQGFLSTAAYAGSVAGGRIGLSYSHLPTFRHGGPLHGDLLPSQRTDLSALYTRLAGRSSGPVVTDEGAPLDDDFYGYSWCEVGCGWVARTCFAHCCQPRFSPTAQTLPQ